MFKASLLEAVEDYLGLWEIQWRYCDYGRDPDLQTAREKSLRLLEELLTNELIQAGSFKDGEFKTWNLSPSETLNQIISEWDALGRDPSIGEIAYFIATPKGEQLASSLK